MLKQFPDVDLSVKKLLYQDLCKCILFVWSTVGGMELVRNWLWSDISLYCLKSACFSLHMPHSHMHPSKPTHASTHSPTHSGTNVLHFFLIMCAGVCFGPSQPYLVQTPRTATGQLWHMPQMHRWLASSCPNIQA